MINMHLSLLDIIIAIIIDDLFSHFCQPIRVFDGDLGKCPRR